MASFFMGAPVIGKKNDWQELLASGRDSLLKNTIEGAGGMPAKGGCDTCSVEELQSAIDYMLDQSL